ncbi:MAG: hypothetical protein US69_C0016G0016 [candidate division TM6 bacterium GW2011_GWF2_38_10]|nr:MAG: hypothetical protein US69_C0016G0016 [candidate division TM6 bacterium GW2011_GWF2_38_10]
MTEQLPWDIQTKRLNNKARRRRFVIRRLALFTLRIELFFNFLMHIFLYASHPSIRCAAYITQDERGHWKIQNPGHQQKPVFFGFFLRRFQAKNCGYPPQMPTLRKNGFCSGAGRRMRPGGIFGKATNFCKVPQLRVLCTLVTKHITCDNLVHPYLSG